MDHVFRFAIDNIVLQDFLVERALNSAYGIELPADELTAYVRPLRLEGTARALLDLIKSSSPSMTNLDQITIPSLLIWGEKDSWVSLDEGYKLEEELPNAKLAIISDSHHMPMITDAEAVNKFIVEFLR